MGDFHHRLRRDWLPGVRHGLLGLHAEVETGNHLGSVPGSFPIRDSHSGDYCVGTCFLDINVGRRPGSQLLER